MCFIEFVGYTCGHTSLPVLRPCPLTTASHTFPTCTRRGDKTFFAGEMCCACQKIIHSRATQIEEYEHRFMHERGVCGCETVFPYLIRPRVIGSCDGGIEEQGVTGCKDGHGHGGHDEHGESDVWTGSRQDNTETTEIQLPPLLCEATDPGGRPVVSVRLPSLYAAEWVVDHRARHDAGLCHCRVDFRTYQKATRDTEAAAQAEADVVEVECDIGLPRPLRQVVSLSTMSWDGHSDESANQERQLTRSSSHEDFSYYMTKDSGPSDDNTGLVAAARALGDRQDGQVAQDGGLATAPTLVLPYPSKSVRYAGAVFAEVPEYLQLTGPFLAQPSPYNQGSDQMVMLDCVLDGDGGQLSMVGGGGEEQGNGAFSGRAAQNQPTSLLPPSVAHRQSRRWPQAQTVAEMKEHHEQQARKREPLVGFPLGAGPEGVSHAIPWCNRPPCWKRS